MTLHNYELTRLKKTSLSNHESQTPRLILENEIALNISKLTLWNPQCKKAHDLVKRLMKSYQIKPAGMLIHGDPGTGKTHFAKKLKGMAFENITQDVLDDHKKRPVIIVTAPKQSTIPKMVNILLEELGDPNPSVGSLTEKEYRLYHALKNLCVQLIIVDEIHDFLPSTSKGTKSSALAWLKGLMDNTLIPILLLGTDKALLIQDIYKELASRIRYTTAFVKFSVEDDQMSKFLFCELVQSLVEQFGSKANILKSFNFIQTDSNGCCTFSNESLLLRLYVATDGIPRGIRDFFLELNIEIHTEDNFKANLPNLAQIYSMLDPISINEKIDFNPFSVDMKVIYKYLKMNVKNAEGKNEEN